MLKLILYIYIVIRNQMASELRKKLKGLRRERAIEQGFYDGRFQTKTVPNKKKVKNKKLCREKIQTDFYIS